MEDRAAKAERARRQLRRHRESLLRKRASADVLAPAQNSAPPPAQSEPPAAPTQRAQDTEAPRLAADLWSSTGAKPGAQGTGADPLALGDGLRVDVDGGLDNRTEAPPQGVSASDAAPKDPQPAAKDAEAPAPSAPAPETALAADLFADDPAPSTLATGPAAAFGAPTSSSASAPWPATSSTGAFRPVPSHPNLYAPSPQRAASMRVFADQLEDNVRESMMSTRATDMPASASSLFYGSAQSDDQEGTSFGTTHEYALDHPSAATYGVEAYGHEYPHGTHDHDAQLEYNEYGAFSGGHAAEDHGYEDGGYDGYTQEAHVGEPRPEYGHDECEPGAYGHEEGQADYGHDGYDPETYGHDGYDPETYGHDGYDPATYGQGSHDPESYGQESYDPETYGQGNYDHETYGHDNYDPETYGQDGYDPDIHGQEGYAYAEYGQPGYGQAAGQDGYDDAAYGHDDHGGQGADTLGADGTDPAPDAPRGPSSLGLSEDRDAAAGPAADLFTEPPSAGNASWAHDLALGAEAEPAAFLDKVGLGADAAPGTDTAELEGAMAFGPSFLAEGSTPLETVPEADESAPSNEPTDSPVPLEQDVPRDVEETPSAREHDAEPPRDEPVAPASEATGDAPAAAAMADGQAPLPAVSGLEDVPVDFFGAPPAAGAFVLDDDSMPSPMVPGTRKSPSSSLDAFAFQDLGGTNVPSQATEEGREIMSPAAPRAPPPSAAPAPEPEPDVSAARPAEPEAAANAPAEGSAPLPSSSRAPLEARVAELEAALHAAQAAADAERAAHDEATARLKAAHHEDMARVRADCAQYARELDEVRAAKARLEREFAERLDALVLEHERASNKLRTEHAAALADAGRAEAPRRASQQSARVHKRSATTSAAAPRLLPLEESESWHAPESHLPRRQPAHQPLMRRPDDLSPAQEHRRRASLQMLRARMVSDSASPGAPALPTSTLALLPTEGNRVASAMQQPATPAQAQQFSQDALLFCACCRGDLIIV